MGQNRRGLLIFATLGAGMLALPRLWPKRISDMTTESAEPGFRMLETGALSARQDPFIGLNTRPEGYPAPRDPDDLCAVLFRDGPDREKPQIAYFTDANCPQCRLMERWFPGVAAREAQITTHDLALLGDGSLAAARAIGAARYMNAAPAMRARLHRSRVQAEPAYLSELAISLELDPAALRKNLERPEIDQVIGDSLGASARLGIPGTPALVIGDLVVLGRIEEARFQNLMALYRPAPCMNG